MIVITYPFVIAFKALSRLLSSQEHKQGLTREELALMAEISQKEGEILVNEYKIIRNLLKLDRVSVNKVMTPRSVAFLLPRDKTCRETVDEFVPLRYSRIPIYGADPDDVLGIALRHDIYEAIHKGEGNRPVGELATPIHAVPETMTVRDALNTFVSRSEHMFLVVDEHGGTDGLITLEDAIETLLGVEIVDETDAVADMRELAGELFRARLRGRRI
jgi:CBS domain containing-hemolysin-like protein